MRIGLILNEDISATVKFVDLLTVISSLIPDQVTTLAAKLQCGEPVVVDCPESRVDVIRCMSEMYELNEILTIELLDA